MTPLADSVKDIYRLVVGQRVRDSVWALRTRKDKSVLAGVVRGMFGVLHAPGTTREHLMATLDWLCAAHDATGTDGVSAFYDVRSGTWCPPYPETTGYIIPTFYNAATHLGDDSYRRRAERMADWLVGLQLESGAFPVGPLWPDWERRPVVFDTGQILHGLVRIHREKPRPAYLDAAVRAGNWLGEIQESDGAWRRFTSSGSEHTYNVRSAWAVLLLHQITGDERHLRTATRNLEWAMTQQTGDAWFRHMEFLDRKDPLTHTIAYTVEGILESAVLLSDSKMFDSARKAAGALMEKQASQGYLRGRYGAGWRSAGNWSCLTGTAQMALVWFRLHELTGRNEYLQAAMAANDHIKRRQCRGSSLAGVRGGIAGSWPVYGDYEPYRNLNWAAKFFVDSLLLEEHLHSRSDSHARPVRQ
jgi:hypothetical protein